jgi:hypothetical protein
MGVLLIPSLCRGAHCDRSLETAALPTFHAADSRA